MYSSYDSNTKLFVIKCQNCNKEAEVRINNLEVYTPQTGDGLFLRFPECPQCKAVCTVYTGINPENIRCHAHWVCAKAAVKEGAKMHCPNPNDLSEVILSKVKEKLDVLETKYENGSVKHQQFLGDAEFIFPEPGR
jgi:hypothetical protein